MIQPSEIIVLLVGLLCTGVICWFWKRLQEIPSANTIFTAFFFLLAGWILTNLEGYFWKDTVNLVEHICYATSSVLLAIWTWKVFAAKEAAR